MSITTGASPPPSPHPALSASPSQQQQKEEATAFLRSLLNKNLQVTTTDNRMFYGEFKCTDSESNIILAHTYEYRQPTAQQISSAAAASDSSSGKVTMDMTSRYLGLVVVPGKYIVRIEAQEFTSQLRRGKGSSGIGVGEQRGVGGAEGVAVG
ncbi:lsm domain-containing protein [Achaetomium macrosporum]|uniref:Lsm domain-containing protein n=1 Tax=Achaetomium macrosporum TaxID=79813 RepID=A0AAN7HG35_9PEZI|nr:lsm domain-containing protein [Achaetomium macrosporum]